MENEIRPYDPNRNPTVQRVIASRRHPLTNIEKYDGKNTRPEDSQSRHDNLA